ncbi:MAG: sodium/proline symporter PutP [Propionibacteriaceae bacterium]|uniref:Sodium/proline symporter n=1 Tax=Propionibacterium ruminifibrarum TaxID=1962131 RepID=A0A375I0U9_9ACTN|nr:sodium/proline symporter PutP [Propionibacterium ruminifibrarum]MBE6478308.1 sodium/proline symporter PutP [Propionibacteriaceae bacterium]SPF67715.1 Na_Pro_sym: sodium/proline symporter [Propionibacterium ruminifibrarum]
MSTMAWQIVAMVVYLAAMVWIGFWGNRQTVDLGDYMLGGRRLPPAVSALSAGAADMSGWLLMGLPGAVYASGLVEAWIGVGLTVGAWFNWKVVAPRLRAYTEIARNSITIPSFFGNRLHDTSGVLRIVTGLIILVYFTFYISSGMVSGGTFFESSFGLPYMWGMLLVAVVTVGYTLVGGFLAVSWTDVVQGLMMLVALVGLPIVGLVHVGGPGAAIAQIRAVDPDLTSLIRGGTVIGIVSALAWGLGYFGQPHILVRLMALSSPAEAGRARRIGIGWMILSYLGAVATALIGVAVYRHDTGRLDNPETVFITLAQLLFHPLIAGFLLAAILAAVMSTISSQLIVTSSALVEDLYRGITHRQLSPTGGVWAGRIGVLAVALVAMALAAGRNDTILGLVAFAWAGFGAGFGPTTLLSLWWRRLTTAGAAAGMIVGAALVFIWDHLGDVYGGIFELYEILPGFCANLVVAVVVSLLTRRPDDAIDAEFARAVELAEA